MVGVGWPQLVAGTGPAARLPVPTGLALISPSADCFAAKDWTKKSGFKIVLELFFEATLLNLVRTCSVPAAERDSRPNCP